MSLNAEGPRGAGPKRESDQVQTETAASLPPVTLQYNFTVCYLSLFHIPPRPPQFLGFCVYRRLSTRISLGTPRNARNSSSQLEAGFQPILWQSQRSTSSPPATSSVHLYPNHCLKPISCHTSNHEVFYTTHPMADKNTGG